MPSSLEFEWLSVKAESNFLKHGVRFEDATLVFTDERRIETMDVRKNYGEERRLTVGLAEGTLLAVVYTLRGWPPTIARLISARKANLDERKKYRQVQT